MLMLLVTTQVPQPGNSKVRLTVHTPCQVELVKRALHSTWLPLPLMFWLFGAAGRL